MRRIVLWCLSTLSAVVLLFGYHTSTSGPAGTAQQPISSHVAPAAAGTSSGTAGAGPGAGASASASAGATTVTGGVVQTQWGPVQVQLTTDASGAITGVQVLQYPSGNSKDEEINAYALPILVDETVSAQGADIDMVSGATVTSQGYLSSLQSALDQLSA